MNKILMYHSIGSQTNGEVGARLYSVPEEKFREQMGYIKSLGSVPCFNSSGSVPFNPCKETNGDRPFVVGDRPFVVGDRPFVIGDRPLITFDDGDVTNYRYTYPILKELGLRAYFFVIVSKIGAQGYMDWEQVRELMDAGMIIGSHGMTHKILTGISEGDLDYELRISKKILEDELRCSISCFSVPRGFYNREVIQQAKNNGYKTVFTSNPKDDDGFKVGRIPVKGNWDLEKFIRVINNGLSVKDKAREWIKNSSKKILGAKKYDRIRSEILKE